MKRPNIHSTAARAEGHVSNTVHTGVLTIGEVKISIHTNPSVFRGLPSISSPKCTWKWKDLWAPSKGIFCSSVFPSREGDSQLQIRTVLAFSPCFLMGIPSRKQNAHVVLGGVTPQLLSWSDLLLIPPSSSQGPGSSAPVTKTRFSVGRAARCVWTPTPEKQRDQWEGAHMYSTITVATFHRALPLAGPGGCRSNPPDTRPHLHSSCVQGPPPVPTPSTAAEAGSGCGRAAESAVLNSEPPHSHLSWSRSHFCAAHVFFQHNRTHKPLFLKTAHDAGASPGPVSCAGGWMQPCPQQEESKATRWHSRVSPPHLHLLNIRLRWGHTPALSVPSSEQRRSRESLLLPGPLSHVSPTWQGLPDTVYSLKV